MKGSPLVYRKKHPPRGGLLFTMFPDKEPERRGPPSKHKYKFPEGDPRSLSSWTGNIGNRKPSRGGGGLSIKVPMGKIGPEIYWSTPTYKDEGVSGPDMYCSTPTYKDERVSPGAYPQDRPRHVCEHTNVHRNDKHVRRPFHRLFLRYTFFMIFPDFFFFNIHRWVSSSAYPEDTHRYLFKHTNIQRWRGLRPRHILQHTNIQRWKGLPSSVYVGVLK